MNKNNTPESYTGIYSIHKYWSKKPHNLVQNLITKYSSKNDIVMDPFCGSGISIIESVLTKRKTVGFDINPMSTFLTELSLLKVDVEKLESIFRDLENSCSKKINEMYGVKRNQIVHIGTHFIWSNGKLTEIWYKNRIGKKIITHPNAADLKQSKSFSYDKIKTFYPTNNFFHNSRINANSKHRICDLFTPRNTTALAFLLSEINKIPDEDIKNLMKLCFTSSLGQSSKMVFVINNRKNSGKSTKKELGSWVIGYWVPKENFEVNVWNCFFNRYRRILKAKQEQAEDDYKTNFVNSFKKIKNGNVFLKNTPAIDGIKTLPSNSIDYIITDPPHGNRIPYLELSMMWNSWLGNNVNYEDEIIVSESKDREKNIENYTNLLTKSFTQIVRVLKNNSFFTLMFNSLDDKTWIHLLTMINGLKIELADITTMSYSANSVVQDNRKHGLKTDFVLTFKKNSKKQIQKTSNMLNVKTLENLVISFIQKNPNSESYKILNSVILKCIKKNNLFELSKIISIIEASDTKSKR